MGAGRTVYLCIGEDVWGDDLVRAKSLSRVDKRGQNLSCLATFACERVSDVTSQATVRPKERRAGDLLLMDEGSGLLRLKPMAAARVLCGEQQARELWCCIEVVLRRQEGGCGCPWRAGAGDHVIGVAESSAGASLVPSSSPSLLSAHLVAFTHAHRCHRVRHLCRNVHPEISMQTKKQPCAACFAAASNRALESPIAVASRGTPALHRCYAIR